MCKIYVGRVTLVTEVKCWLLLSMNIFLYGICWVLYLRCSGMQWALCCFFFSNDQTRKSRNEENAWRFWRVHCSVYAQVCAARSGYKWQWTRGPDTSWWCASSAVISKESYKCTVYKCSRYLWIGCTNTPVSIWGRNVFNTLHAFSCSGLHIYACLFRYQKWGNFTCYLQVRLLIWQRKHVQPIKYSF